MRSVLMKKKHHSQSYNILKQSIKMTALAALMLPTYHVLARDTTTQPPYITSKIQDQSHLDLRLFQNGQTQITATRKLNGLLPKQGVIRWEDIPNTLQYNSLRSSLSNAQITGVSLPTSQYPATISETTSPLFHNNNHLFLSYMVGKEIIWTLDGFDRLARLIALTNSGPLIEFKDGIILNPKGRLKLSSIEQIPQTGYYADFTYQQKAPTNSHTQPIKNMTLSYLVQDLHWQTTYHAALNEDRTKIKLSGFVDITNPSKRSYHADSLELVVGNMQPQMNRPLTMAQAQAAPISRGLMKAQDTIEATISAPTQHADRYIYRLSGKQILPSKTRKRFPLFAQKEIPVETKYSLDWHMPWRAIPKSRQPNPQNPSMTLTFTPAQTTNSTQENISSPSISQNILPEGDIQFYHAQKNQSNEDLGQQIYLGQDHVKNSSLNQKQHFKLGQAFDINVEHIQTAFKQKGTQNRAIDVSYDIIVHNNKNESAIVHIRDFLPGNGQITKTNGSYIQTSPNSIDWTITVPASEKITINYSASIQR